MDGVIEKWSHWAPRDARGSEDYATLEALRTTVNKAGFKHCIITETYLDMTVNFIILNISYCGKRSTFKHTLSIM
jgi:hypothetical protein